MRVNEPNPFFNGPQVLGSECQVLKDSMSFILNANLITVQIAKNECDHILGIA